MDINSLNHYSNASFSAEKRLVWFGKEAGGDSPFGGGGRKGLEDSNASRGMKYLEFDPEPEAPAETNYPIQQSRVRPQKEKVDTTEFELQLEGLKKSPGKMLKAARENYDKISPMIEKLTPEQLFQYVIDHKPSTYDGNWPSWNEDFVKDYLKAPGEEGYKEKRNPSLYVAVFQLWLRRKKQKIGGVDGRMGRGTVRGLAKYLCSINKDLCLNPQEMDSGKKGSGKEKGEQGEIDHWQTVPGLTEEQFESIKEHYWSYIDILDVTGNLAGMARYQKINSAQFSKAFYKCVTGLTEQGIEFDPTNLGAWQNIFEHVVNDGILTQGELELIYPYFLRPEFITHDEYAKKYKFQIDQLKRGRKMRRKERVRTKMPSGVRIGINQMADDFWEEKVSGKLGHLPKVGVGWSGASFAEITKEVAKAKTEGVDAIDSFELMESSTAIKSSYYAYKNFYEVWKTAEDYYEDNRIADTEGLSVEETREEKQKLEAARKRKNNAYSQLKSMVKFYLDEHDGVHARMHHTYKERLQKLASKYEFESGAVSFQEIVTKCNFETYTGYGHWPEPIKAHFSAIRNFPASKFLNKVPTKTVKSLDDINLYIKGETKEEFRKNKIELGRLASEKGMKLVDLMNHYIYFSNYEAFAKGAKKIKSDMYDWRLAEVKKLKGMDAKTLRKRRTKLGKVAHDIVGSG